MIENLKTDMSRMNQYTTIDQDTAEQRRPSHGTSNIQPPLKLNRHHRNNIHGHDGPASAADHNVVSPAQSPPVCRSPPVDLTIKQPNVGPAVLPNQIHPTSTNQHVSSNHGAGSIHLPSNKMVGPGQVIQQTNQVGASASTNQVTRVVHAGTNQMSTGAASSGSPVHPMERAWASFEEDNQGLLTSEHKEWAHFTDSSKHDTSSMSSEGECAEDVWSITDEQRDYYINQYKTMQPDVRGVISGGVAKEFFEKSRLPVAELSKIWQLSDVNRDGALSLEEFCTAMHLVVLRRNEIELPDHLPAPLIPYVPLNPEEPFASDLPPGSTLKRISPVVPSPPQTTQQQWSGGYVRGQESPTSSSVSSPGSKPTPVNFDYKPITADPGSKIIHPVALRMSPDGLAVMVEGNDPEYDADVTSPTGYHGDTGDDQVPPGTLPTFGVQPIQGRPRPTPKKSQSVAGAVVEYTVAQRRLLPPPSSQEQNSAAGDRPVTLPVGCDELAPMPPPRPRSGHARSTSLDEQIIDNQLYDFFEQRSQRLNQTQPPMVPPRLSHNTEGAVSIEEIESNNPYTVASADGLSGALKSVHPTYTSTPAKPLVNKMSAETKTLRETLRTQRLKNLALCRVNDELNQELQEVMEQRIALEIQLEHLRPFHS